MSECEKCGTMILGRVYTVRRLGLKSVCLSCGNSAVAANPATPEEVAKRRRQQRARDRYAAMRSLGMVRTPYGWE